MWNNIIMEHTLEFETMVDCSVEKLFAFHADTENLALITPPGITVEILKLETPLKEGNEAELKIRKGIFLFVWKLVFENVTYPNLIVDCAIRSPFKSFRHEHHFIRVNGGHSLLRDRVTFSLPLWPLSLPLVWFIKRDMEKMFSYRHRQTAKLLAQ
jgi:ligand-binding SRPBCC domain-containing protein